MLKNLKTFFIVNLELIYVWFHQIIYQFHIPFIYQYYSIYIPILYGKKKKLFRKHNCFKRKHEYNNSTLYHSYRRPQTSPSVNCLQCLFLVLLLKTQCSPEEQFLQPHSVFFIVHHTSTIKKNSQSDTISLLSPSLSKRNMCSNINVMVALKDNMKVQQRRKVFFLGEGDTVTQKNKISKKIVSSVTLSYLAQGALAVRGRF